MVLLYVPDRLLLIVPDTVFLVVLDMVLLDVHDNMDYAASMGSAVSIQDKRVEVKMSAFTHMCLNLRVFCIKMFKILLNIWFYN